MATKTYDIEDIASAAKKGFNLYFTSLIHGHVMVALPWLAAFGSLPYDAIEWCVNLAGTKGGLVGFMLSNRVINIDKREDYFDALKRVEELPDDVDDATWDKAEREANAQFRNLFSLTA